MSTVSATGPRLVLASASPRRLDLLKQIGFPPDLVTSPSIDESPQKGEVAVGLAERLASSKCAVVAAVHPSDFVLAADTVVACGRRILPKADSRDSARACLDLLSGRTHVVSTGVCVISPDKRKAVRVVSTRVRFKRLSIEEIDGYLASGEWEGKAGGYAIQGLAGAFVTLIAGSYSTVVGLPLYEAAALLGGLNYRPASRWEN